MIAQCAAVLDQKLAKNVKHAKKKGINPIFRLDRVKTGQDLERWTRDRFTDDQTTTRLLCVWQSLPAPP